MLVFNEGYKYSGNLINLLNLTLGDSEDGSLCHKTVFLFAIVIHFDFEIWIWHYNCKIKCKIHIRAIVL